MATVPLKLYAITRPGGWLCVRGIKMATVPLKLTTQHPDHIPQVRGIKMATVPLKP